MVFRKPQFFLRAEHALRKIAKSLSRANFKITWQHSANLSAGYQEPLADIRSTANDIEWFSSADIHLADIQVIAFFHLIARKNFGHYYAGEFLADSNHLIIFQASQSITLSQFLCRHF